MTVYKIFLMETYILFPESIQSEGGACDTQEDLFGFNLVTQSTMTNDSEHVLMFFFSYS